jgi:hypothetical protein
MAFIQRRRLVSRLCDFPTPGHNSIKRQDGLECQEISQKAYEEWRRCRDTYLFVYAKQSIKNTLRSVQ